MSAKKADKARVENGFSRRYLRSILVDPAELSSRRDSASFRSCSSPGTRSPALLSLRRRCDGNDRGTRGPGSNSKINYRGEDASETAGTLETRGRSGCGNIRDGDGRGKG